MAGAFGEVVIGGVTAANMGAGERRLAWLKARVAWTLAATIVRASIVVTTAHESRQRSARSAMRYEVTRI